MPMIHYRNHLLDPTDEDEDPELVEEWLNEEYRRLVGPSVSLAYSPEDHDAHDQAFNDWTDSMCKAGELADKFYNSICRDDGDGPPAGPIDL